MKYALGNMLNGAGGLNPDGLALDLQFAADKTLTARKGPTPTFTRASTGRFVGSNGLIQSSAINAPRFDHDPVTGVCKGLLMEESRTNTLLASESFDSASWANTGKNLAITADAVLSPSGLLNADKLTVGATTTTYMVIQTTPSFVSGTAYTVSCFFKADQVTRVALYATTVATFPANAIFDLTGSGSVVQNSSGVASITPYANGWYRCQITGTAGASVPTTIRISPVTGTSLNYVGNSIDSFYAWGAQLEIGAFPTSYIPTATGTLTRSADVCSITGSAFTSIWNGVDISVLHKGVRQSATSGNYWSLTSGTLATSISADRGSATERLAAAGVGIVIFTGLGANQSIRTAYAVKQGDYAGSLNGSNIVVSSSSHVPAFTSFQIGTSHSQTIAGAAWISEIKTFRKRLPNAKLQTLTV